MLPTKFRFIWPHTVSQEKIQIWKAYWRQRPSDGLSVRWNKNWPSKVAVACMTVLLWSGYLLGKWTGSTNRILEGGTHKLFYSNFISFHSVVLKNIFKDYKFSTNQKNCRPWKGQHHKSFLVTLLYNRDCIRSLLSSQYMPGAVSQVFLITIHYNRSCIMSIFFSYYVMTGAVSKVFLVTIHYNRGCIMSIFCSQYLMTGTVSVFFCITGCINFSYSCINCWQVCSMFLL